MLAATAVGVIWYYVYATERHHQLSLCASSAGDRARSFGWLYEADRATAAIIVTHLWQQVGLTMVLLLLGLDAMPTDPIEAAKVDGASRWQIFRHIMLAAAGADVLVVVTISVLAGFTAFDLLWVMGATFPTARPLRSPSTCIGSPSAPALGAMARRSPWFSA